MKTISTTLQSHDTQIISADSWVTKPPQKLFWFFSPSFNHSKVASKSQTHGVSYVKAKNEEGGGEGVARDRGAQYQRSQGAARGWDQDQRDTIIFQEREKNIHIC